MKLNDRTTMITGTTGSISQVTVSLLWKVQS